MNSTFNNEYRLDEQEHGLVIREAAQRGSAMAKKIVEIWALMNSTKNTFDRNNRQTFFEDLSKAIRLDFQLVDIPQRYKAVITEAFFSCPTSDRDVLTCFFQINKSNGRIWPVINEALNMFPGDEHFLDLQICCNVASVVNRKIEALALANRALELYPTSLRFIFWRAVCLCLLDDHSSCIEALDAFLSVAPKDHNKVPACHYRKAMHYASRKNDEMFVKSYEEAIESETHQLPCFLPYKFPCKVEIEMCYHIAKRNLEERSNPNVYVFYAPY